MYEGIRDVKHAIVRGTLPRRYAAWLERSMESSKERRMSGLEGETDI